LTIVVLMIAPNSAVR